MTIVLALVTVVGVLVFLSLVPERPGRPTTTATYDPIADLANEVAEVKQILRRTGRTSDGRFTSNHWRYTVRLPDRSREVSEAWARAELEEGWKRQQEYDRKRRAQ